MKTTQILSILLSVLVVLSLVLMALGKISKSLFWVIIALSGLVAYKVIPKLKE